MVATALLVAVVLGIPHKTIGQVITGATVNASSLTCGTAPLLASAGILYIGDGINPTTLNMNANLDLSCLGPIKLIIRNNATLHFPANSVILYLSASSTITINITSPTGNISSSVCNVQREINIGTVRYATCNGGGAGTLYSFADLMACGGTKPTTAITICQGGIGSLTSSFTCPAGGTFTSVAKDAGTGTNVNVPGRANWAAAGNIVSSGTPYATVPINPNNSSGYLQGKNYGFAIPLGATINGVQVSIYRLSSLNILGVSISDVDLTLLKNGVIIGADKALPIGWPDLINVANYGGTSDLWGTTWTAAEINNAGFGASLSVENPSIFFPRVATVDYMQISVTYTVPPATLDWYTAPSGGIKIGSGTPFNPVGVAGSGLIDANTPGTTTYYAECSTSPGCRTATDFVITPSLPASVSIAAVPSGALCPGTSVTFTATPTNGGVGPTYIWKKGGIPIAGATAATYTSTALANNDKITVEMTSNATCVTGSPATSNEITVAVTPTVGIPVFTIIGISSTRYQAAESITYIATEASSSVITYSLDAISKAAGNTIDPTTGLLSYSGIWSGTSIITASVTGCNGTRTATHSVRTNWCFALYAGAGAIHNDLLSTVTGDIGSNTGLIDGFGGGLAGTVNGTIHNNDATTLQAVTDLDDLFSVLDTKPINHVITTLDNTQIVEPGVYFLGAAAPLNGELILDGGGDPDAVFIIKIGGALSTQALSKVTLQNGTSVNNVYWIIKGAANIGENSVFRGTFIGTGEINLLTGSKLFGRALTKVGAITLTNCEVSSICAPYTCMSDIEPPTFTTPTLNPGYCVEDIYQAVYKDGAEGTSTDLTFLRPDYYNLLTVDFNILNLISPADNCALLTNPISWTITFADGSDNIAGTSQLSNYVPISPLPGIKFPLGTNHITYTVTDLAGNTTIKSIDLVVTPRPGFN